MALLSLLDLPSDSLLTNARFHFRGYFLEDLCDILNEYGIRDDKTTKQVLFFFSSFRGVKCSYHILLACSNTLRGYEHLQRRFIFP